MKPTERACLLRRRLLKCDTTRAGETTYCPESNVYARSTENTKLGLSACRSADIALVAGGERKRWIIATENMQAGDIIKTSGVIGRMAGTGSRFFSWRFVGLRNLYI